MYITPYNLAIDFMADQSPDLQESATKLIAWAEPICELLAFIYNENYDQVTEDLYKAIKEAQGYEDEE